MTTWLTATGLAFFLLSAKAEALNNPTGEVTIEKQEDFSKSYKNRRGTHGALLSLSHENFFPTNYRSLFNDAYIEDILNEDKISLIGLELGYKYNVGITSVSALVIYGQGSKEGAFGGQPRTLKINKQGLSFNFALDGILKEPWIAPYVQAGVHQFSVTESNGANSETSATGMSINYKYGLLFQLDWIENFFDNSATADRLRSSGLENTYIDVYFAEHLASSKAINPAVLTLTGEPNMYSTGEIGIGLKMEF